MDEELQNKARNSLAKLSPAAREACFLVAKGYSQQEAASALGKAQATIRAQLYRAYGVLGISTAQQLATLFTLAGEITSWEG